MSVVVTSADRDAALRRYEPLLGAAAHEFPLPGRGLTVTVLPGLSILSGEPEALASVRDLRATAFVDSLAEIEALLVRMGWTTEGSLGAGTSLLARDPEGTVIEFVENTPTGAAT